METRIAVLSIIVEDMERTGQLNELIHEYSAYVVGRMGIPYRLKNIYIICVALDAPQEIISAISGKVGNLSGVSSKTAYSGRQ